MMFYKTAVIAAVASAGNVSADSFTKMPEIGACQDYLHYAYDRIVNLEITAQVDCETACIGFSGASKLRGMETDGEGCACLFDDGELPPHSAPWTAVDIYTGVGPVMEGNKLGTTPQIECFRYEYDDECSYGPETTGKCADDMNRNFDALMRANTGSIDYCRLLCAEFKDFTLRGIEYGNLGEDANEMCLCLFDDDQVPPAPTGWVNFTDFLGVGPVRGTTTGGLDDFFTCQAYTCQDEVEDPFTLVGGGVCVDANRFQYDHATIEAADLMTCKVQCAFTFTEIIRGVQFLSDTSNNVTKCDCLADDGSVPPEFDEFFTSEFLGDGEIFGSDNIAGNWECHAFNVTDV